ncbi:SPW repeat protein [Streptomyces sp. ISL-36]|uniref:SPW repeat protein n=1 Tax=Streptomyces sp. ISL-36 TaxID=2819182 RepID=UPI0020364052|nr:SPW repeat protein [Streptomyces sp. ISL-36]
MRDRYSRMLQTRGVAAVEELVILAGIYAAVSGWVVHFSAARPELALSNLVVGITLAVMGLCMSMAPERSHDLNFVVLLLGAWLIISPWVVATSDAGTGAILSNVITGACVCLFALTAGGLLMSKRKT